jgi:hypothetical protein
MFFKKIFLFSSLLSVPYASSSSSSSSSSPSSTTKPASLYPTSLVDLIVSLTQSRVDAHITAGIKACVDSELPLTAPIWSDFQGIKPNERAVSYIERTLLVSHPEANMFFSCMLSNNLVSPDFLKRPSNAGPLLFSAASLAGITPDPTSLFSNLLNKGAPIDSTYSESMNGDSKYTIVHKILSRDKYIMGDVPQRLLQPVHILGSEASEHYYFFLTATAEAIALKLGANGTEARRIRNAAQRLVNDADVHKLSSTSSNSSLSNSESLGRRVPYQYIEILSNGLAQSTLLDVLRHLRTMLSKYSTGVYRRLLTQQDVFGRSPLHVAALNNNAGSIALILHELETLSNTDEYKGIIYQALVQKDVFGLSPRQLAISLNRKSITALLSKAEGDQGINTVSVDVLPAAANLRNAENGVAPLVRIFNNSSFSRRVLSYSPDLTLKAKDDANVLQGIGNSGGDNGGWGQPAFIRDEVEEALLTLQQQNDEDDECEIDVIDFLNEVNVNSTLKAIDILHLYLSTSRPVLLRGLAINWPIRDSWRLENLHSRNQTNRISVITGEIPYANRFGKQSAKVSLSQHVNGLLHCTPEIVSGMSPIPSGTGLDKDLCNLYAANKTSKLSNYLFQSFDEGLESSDLIDDIVILPWFLNTRLPLFSEFVNVDPSSGVGEQVSDKNATGPHVMQNSPSAPVPQLYIGGPGSGAPFHYHFDAFNVLVWGEKRWFFKSPNSGAEYSTVPALDYVRFFRKKSTNEHPIECTQRAGDVIIIPSGWSHAVLNTKTSIGFAVEFDSPLHSRY